MQEVLNLLKLKIQTIFNNNKSNTKGQNIYNNSKIVLTKRVESNVELIKHFLDKNMSKASFSGEHIKNHATINDYN